VRTAALVEHLTLRYVASPATLFEGIEKLEPGHVLAVDASGAERRRFWSVAYEPKAELDDHQALAELETRLTESVRMRLMSEVPLGALLSGGVDSSVVVAIMSRLLSRPVQTFSVGFDAPGPFSELPFARRVATHFGTEHRDLVVGARDLLRELPALVWHQDEPVSAGSRSWRVAPASVTNRSAWRLGSPGSQATSAPGCSRPLCARRSLSRPPRSAKHSTKAQPAARSTGCSTWTSGSGFRTIC